MSVCKSKNVTLGFKRRLTDSDEIEVKVITGHEVVDRLHHSEDRDQ